MRRSSRSRTKSFCQGLAVLRRPSTAFRPFARDGNDAGPWSASRRSAAIRECAPRAADRMESGVDSQGRLSSTVRRDCGRHGLLLRQLLCRECRKRNCARRLRWSVHGRRAQRTNSWRGIPSGKIVSRRNSSSEEFREMDLIPSIDVLQGNAVRLTGGQFTLVTKYGAPEDVLDSLKLER